MEIKRKVKKMKKNKSIDKETRLKNIENAVREILINIGEDAEREGLVETPKRVAKMYDEILSTKSVDDFENYKFNFFNLNEIDELEKIEDFEEDVEDTADIIEEKAEVVKEKVKK